MLLLLICKVTLNGPAPCVPSPSQACLWDGVGRGVLVAPQILGPVTNPHFRGPWDLPAYTPLQCDYRL